MTEWYALQVQSGREQHISELLRYKGIDVCLLLYRSVRRWSDREKKLTLAAFPGYVFCCFDLEHRVQVVSTPGVIAIIGHGRTPVSIPPQEIDSLRLIERSGQQGIPSPRLSLGREVWIDGGALKGVQGRLVEYKKHCRVAVSVQLLQRSVLVDVDAAHVRLGEARPLERPGNGCFTSPEEQQIQYPLVHS